MGEILGRGDLRLYETVFSAIEVHLQSYNVIHRCAVWARNSGRLKNRSLTTAANLGSNDVTQTQCSFYIGRNKLAKVPVDYHAIYRASDWSAYVFLSQNPITL